MDNIEVRQKSAVQKDSGAIIDNDKNDEEEYEQDDRASLSNCQERPLLRSMVDKYVKKKKQKGIKRKKEGSDVSGRPQSKKVPPKTSILFLFHLNNLRVSEMKSHSYNIAF